MVSVQGIDIENLLPGRRFESEIILSGRWFDDLCLWLQRPLGEAGPVGWPLVLIPELADPGWRLGDDCLGVFRRVVWWEEIPAGPLDLAGETAWVSSRDGRVEVGLASLAKVRGRELARSLLVVRTPGNAGTWGTRDLPPVPELAGLYRRKSLVVAEGQVLGFSTLLGTRNRLHSDPGHARGRGFPDIVVPGEILLMLQLHHSAAQPSGQIEMWFRQPVPVGSLLEWCHEEPDESLFAFRMVGSGAVVAVARCSPAPGRSG